MRHAYPVVAVVVFIEPASFKETAAHRCKIPGGPDKWLLQSQGPRCLPAIFAKCPCWRPKDSFDVRLESVIMYVHVLFCTFESEQQKLRQGLVVPGDPGTIPAGASLPKKGEDMQAASSIGILKECWLRWLSTLPHSVSG